jgi:hypothetical protein
MEVGSWGLIHSGGDGEEAKKETMQDSNTELITRLPCDELLSFRCRRADGTKAEKNRNKNADGVCLD